MSGKAEDAGAENMQSENMRQDNMRQDDMRAENVGLESGAAAKRAGGVSVAGVNAACGGSNAKPAAENARAESDISAKKAGAKNAVAANAAAESNAGAGEDAESAAGAAARPDSVSGASGRAPRLRFAGFTEPWQKMRMGELFSERSERAVGDEELLSVTIGNGVIRQADSDKRDISSRDKSNYKIVRKGDVPYNSMRMWQGAVGVSGYDGIVSPAYTVLIPSSEANGKFFMKLFKKEYNLQIFRRWSQGLTSDTWNLKYPLLSGVSFYVPSKSEQDEIAKFFSGLDRIISVQERKTEALRQAKKYFLQNMFPRRGESAPRLRFAGFDKPWQMREVSELLVERNEQAPESKKYPLMAFIGNKGVAPKGERYDRGALIKDAKNKNYKRTELGDFIYSSNNLETGSIGLNNYGNASISPVYSIFKSTGIADSDFIGRRFIRKDFINSMIKWRQGVVYGQWRIHESDFLKIEVPVPSVGEQRQIGMFFSGLDRIISVQERKTEALRRAKKYYLQNMFA